MRDFFKTYQKLILRIGNSSFGKWFLNLGQNQPQRFVEIMPDAFTSHRCEFYACNKCIAKAAKLNQGGELARVCIHTRSKNYQLRQHNISTFFTTPYLAKRLQYILYPLIVIHGYARWSEEMTQLLGIDKKLANQLGTTSTFNPAASFGGDSCDGRVNYDGSSLSWANIRTASGVNGPTTGANEVCFRYISGASANNWDTMDRFLATYPTGATITSGATINSVTTSFVGVSKTDPNSNTPSACLVVSSPVLANNIEATDYNNVGTTEFATRIGYSSLTADSTTYVDFTENASGKASVATGTGTTKRAVRSSNDLDNSEPSASGVQATGWNIKQSDAGGGVIPKMVIDWTVSVAVKRNLMMMGIGK